MTTTAFRPPKTRSREDRRVSKLVRAACSLTGTPYPITFEGGFAPPRLEGESYHWRTRGGRYVYHPSAYARRGWSNLVYHHSTHRIVVGAGWVIEALLADEAAREARRKAACALRAGTAVVRFDAEGCFRIEPSAN